MLCKECEGKISIPEDSLSGEITSCPDCGMRFEIKKDGDQITLKEAEQVGEDWGE